MSKVAAVDLVIFVVLSGVIAYASRASLRQPGSHGFYRFFAWQCMLVLFVMVAGWWFHDPFSFHQLVSWFLLLVSAFLVTYGVYQLRLGGKPNKKRDDESLLAFEKTTILVTEGAYRYIRHPMYSSLLFLTWGMCFKHPNALSVILALGVTGFLSLTAKADEAECIRYFGSSYMDYMKRTKMFIPFLW